MPHRYRAKLIDPGNTNQERPVQTFANDLAVIKEWAYGSQEGGMQRARGVLETAVSERAAVIVYVLEEKQLAIWPKTAKKPE
jgi:hypothetical protein